MPSEIQSSTPPSPSCAVVTAPLHYPVVVLAEDDPVLRRTLSDFLAGEGFMVKEASDLRSLRDVLRGEQPTAVVLDVHLGEHHVGHVLRELGDERPNIVLMSGSNDARQLARDHRLQLLTKPFDLDALVQALLVPLDDRQSDAE
jgi:DNA-binding response OmpR family regulator